MFRILGSHKTLCDGISRRDLLQAGAAGLLGLGLPDLLQSAPRATKAPRSFGRAKNVILLFLYGGVSQLDTFDPKPDAPEDIRGPLRSIPTRLPGVRVCEHLPRLAGLMDRVTLIRSMSHKYPIHGVAYAVTGTGQTDIPMELNRKDGRHWPYFGCVLDRLDDLDRPRSAPPAVPRTVHLPWEQSTRSAPHQRGGMFAGFLGPRYNPLVLEFNGRANRRDTYRPNDPYGGIEASARFRIAATERPADLTVDRLDGRRSLLEQLDARRRLADTQAGEALDHFRQQAFSVCASPKVRDAIDLGRETAAVRRRYGHHLFGQSALCARRLIEAGTRVVSVFWDEFGLSCGAWDTHEKQAPRFKNELCPGFDQTFAALLGDLEQRGLLDETLVLCLTEHGRTPKAERRGDSTDGRGHWSECYSVLMAGAGVAQGKVIGVSDKIAGWPRERPVSPKDVLRTVYHLLGVDAERMLVDRLGRPLPLVAGGEVVREALEA